MQAEHAENFVELAAGSAGSPVVEQFSLCMRANRNAATQGLHDSGRKACLAARARLAHRARQDYQDQGSAVETSHAAWRSQRSRNACVRPASVSQTRPGGQRPLRGIKAESVGGGRDYCETILHVHLPSCPRSRVPNIRSTLLIKNARKVHVRSEKSSWLETARFWSRPRFDYNVDRLH